MALRPRLAAGLPLLCEISYRRYCPRYQCVACGIRPGGYYLIHFFVEERDRNTVNSCVLPIHSYLVLRRHSQESETDDGQTFVVSTPPPPIGIATFLQELA